MTLPAALCNRDNSMQPGRMLGGLLPSRRGRPAAQHAAALLWCLLLLLGAEVAQCQLSAAIASDKHWEAAAGQNKFLARKADNDRDDDSQ